MTTFAIIKEHPQYRYPGPRYAKLGKNSGEEFRDKIFIPWLDSHEDEDITLNIDGFVAYPPSFFKEFLLGTAANEKYKDRIRKIKIECQEPYFQAKIRKILDEIK